MIIYLTAPDTYRATIDGTEWSGITPASRFWQDVQDMIAGGAEVVDLTAPQPPSTDPADYPLYPAQFKAMVDYLGKDSAIRAAIANIPDALARSWSLSRYLNSTRYLWTDPFLQQMRAAVGMTEDELRDAWMLAKELKSD